MGTKEASGEKGIAGIVKGVQPKVSGLPKSLGQLRGKEKHEPGFQRGARVVPVLEKTYYN